MSVLLVLITVMGMPHASIPLEAINASVILDILAMGQLVSVKVNYIHY